MAGSATEAQSHDEGSGGRSTTGMHGSVMGKEQKLWILIPTAMSKRC